MPPNPHSQSYTISNRTHDYAGELSLIRDDLAIQLEEMIRGPPHVTMKTLISLDCEIPPDASSTTPLEDILNTTRRFMHVLALIPDSSQSPDLFASRSSRNNNRESVTETWSSPNISIETSGTCTELTPCSTTLSQVEPDESILGLVLNCYIYILKLHVALFAHIQQYLQMVAESENPTVVPLPGLCGFDNLPLRTFTQMLMSCYNYLG